MTRDWKADRAICEAWNNDVLPLQGEHYTKTADRVARLRPAFCASAMIGWPVALDAAEKGEDLAKAVRAFVKHCRICATPSGIKDEFAILVAALAEFDGQ